MFGDLCRFLESAMLDRERIEVTTKTGDVFTCFSAGDDQSYDNLGWCFSGVEGWNYDAVYLKDIAKVKRVGEAEYFYEYDKNIMSLV